LVIEAGKDKLTLLAQHPDVAIASQLNAPHPVPEVIALPAPALEEAQGRQGSIRLEQTTDKVIVRWTEAGIPRVVEYDILDLTKLPPFPSRPSSFATNPPAVLQALDDAMHSAAIENIRYLTAKVQLRGSGEIVATDSRQLFLQAGFTFPWKDNVLIPRVSLFAANVLPADVPVKVGRTATHVFLEVGPWMIALSADTQGRFPPAEQVIPKAARTIWTLSSAEAEFLIRTLPRLPGEKDSDAPVTLDLNGQAVIRAREGEQSRPAELKLEQSKIVGSPLRLSTNRNLLLRGLQLGFREFRLVDADTPVLAQDSRRRFVFMPLPKDSAIPPSADATQITPEIEKPISSPSPLAKRKKIMTMPHPKPAAATAPPRTTPNPPILAPLTDPVAEAEAVQALLREGLGRISRLVGALKQQRRQSKIVRSALSSLRDLQPPA
jgi:hypothetical protein